MSRIEESISKLKRFKYHAIGRLELEDAIDNVVSWYEQMLKDAVEAEVSAVILRENRDEVHYAITYPEGKGPHSITDKVRIVVLKAEEE